MKIFKSSTSIHSGETSGFTLIELLIVVSIISMFASISMVSVRQGAAHARDNERRQTLKQLQVSLELYRDQNGAYPSTGDAWYSSEQGDIGDYNSGAWIPNLSPVYLSSLPRAPKGGFSATLCQGWGWKSAYLYRSNGTDYDLLSHCSMEGTTWGSSDPFYDLNRSTWGWEVCTPGGCGW